MGRQLSEKRKAHIASLPSSRWKHKESAKENIIPPELIPPRAATRAQNYIKTLENTISDRNTHILALQLSNADLTQQNTALSTQLDTASFRIQSLELDNTGTSQELSVTQERLHNAHDLISTQSHIITQKNQRINRLIRDKSVLSSRIACLKQELAQAVLAAAESKNISNAAALHIESLLQSISRLNSSASVQKAAKDELYRDLRATQMRETRAKTALQKLKEKLAAKSKWNGMKGRAYNSQYRTLVMAFTKAGCAQSRVGPLLSRVGKVLGVSIKRTMGRRTVGRVITEAGVKVRIQLGHELARAKGEQAVFNAGLSSDFSVSTLPQQRRHKQPEHQV